MKSIKSLFILLIFISISFACAPLQDGSITEAPTPTSEVTVDEVAFPWIDDAANCCQSEPIPVHPPRPKI
jgi:hypothetical protein